MHDKYDDEPRPLPQPWLSTKHFYNARRFSADRIGMSENEAGRMCPVRRELARLQIDRGRFVGSDNRVDQRTKWGHFMDFGA
jgi:hypothetical protein